jgi:hypothetical protein
LEAISLGSIIHGRTDHRSLKFILDQRLTTIPQHQWVTKLFGYDLELEVVYHPGRQNEAADALSRRDEEDLTVHALSTTRFEVFDILRAELAADAPAQKLCAQIVDGTAPSGWTEVDGVLLFQGRAYVPDSSSLWPQLLEDAHTADHEGIQRPSIVYSFPSSVPVLAVACGTL